MKLTALNVLQLQKENTWDTQEWIIPLSAALRGLSAEQADWQPPGGGNTIRETLTHLNYYNQRLLNRLKNTASGSGVPTNEATFTSSEHPKDSTGWNALLEETERIATGLGQALDGLTDSDLEAPYSPANAQIPFGEELARWMLHDAYHAGQIVLIRRQQGSWRTEA